MTRILPALIALLFLTVNLFAQDTNVPEICFSFDDSNAKDTPLFDWKVKNKMILDVLKKNDVQAVLFVVGKYIDNQNGSEVLKSWDDAGQLIGNHTYSHYFYPSPKITIGIYENDMLRCDSIIKNYKNYTKLYRFPYLKEGNTIEKRDSFRKFLDSLNYLTACVTVDASDWYIDDRLTTRLKKDVHADISGFKEYYLRHILDRALYYDDLSMKVLNRHVRHCVLLHHNLVSALFLDDLIKLFRSKGWKVINASEAFKDPVYKMKPNILPAGESIIWSLAKETGKYDNILRYPAEDGDYEKDAMDKLGL